MRNKIILGSILLIILSVTAYLVRDRSYEIKMPTSGENIIVFGDSLVEGSGSTAGNDFVSLISKKLNRPVINAGFAGDTTESAKGRLDSDVLQQNPKVVVILLGGNDFLLRMSREQTMQNLRQMISRIQGQGAGVVLVGVRKIIYSSEYENLARETGSIYVPNILDETYGDKALMSDQIHPNDAGYKIFAEIISPAIKKLLE
jgi:acyl-CoA thioesterase-1